MCKFKKLLTIIFFSVAVVCVPLYWTTGALIVGFIGFIAMVIGNIILLYGVIILVRNNKKKRGEDSRGQGDGSVVT